MLLCYSKSRVIRVNCHQVHPVPDFDNLTVLDEVLDVMQDAGLYLMYDMRKSVCYFVAVRSLLMLFVART